MNHSHLVAFITVVREGSISGAAKKLHLTQPALSAQISAIENTLEIKLLDRSNKGIILTEAGEKLLYFAKRMVVLQNNLLEEICTIKSRSQEEIIIGASKAIGGYALPCSIYIFKDKYPNANIQLKIANSEEILQQVLDKSVSFGLFEGPLDHSEIIVSPLIRDELILITPPTEAWKKLKSISLKELQVLKLILRENGSGTRKIIEQALLDAGYDIDQFNVSMVLNDFDAIKASVEADRGVSLISKLAVKKELYTGSLHSVHVEEISFKYSFNVAYPKEIRRTVLEQQFLKFITSPKERGFC